MDLEILSQDDDYEVMDTKRRTIQSESGEEVVLDRVTDVVDWDNGMCKHCVAFLFGLSSFSDRHKDRGIEVGTDVECVWDKPRQQ
ncbi:hypothetical protein FSP39_024614 [Pinctada imbricata]|uniref:Uncharacterized protein n=1 Tax=Pinctada imbricata TaxID=66713 RepID=A0AA89BQV5_PINIB|nr:hypothetical protein FSP39_024614 [Pinctada imbricata]